MICVGTKRGVNYGIVYSDDLVIGSVCKHARVAAGTGGQTLPFWTAHAADSDGVISYASLGTRHPSRRSAVNAVKAFRQAHPTRPVFYHMSRAIRDFKRDHPHICNPPINR